MVAIDVKYNYYYYYLYDKLVYFSTECIEFEPQFRWTEIFTFFDTLELNHTLMHAPRGVCDLPQVDYLPDNILLE